MMYPRAGTHTPTWFAKHVTGPDDCRAWRVFAPMIRALATRRHVDVNTVFLCEPRADEAGRRVYACSSCRTERTYDCDAYDLFDGQTVPPGETRRDAWSDACSSGRRRICCSSCRRALGGGSRL